MRSCIRLTLFTRWKLTFLVASSCLVIHGIQDFPSLAKLFVGGVSWQTTQERMLAYFSTYGEVIDAAIMKNKVTNQPRGFGFIEFKDPASAEAVLNAGPHNIDGRDVDIKRAVPRNRAPASRKGKTGTPNRTGDAGASPPPGGSMPANMGTNATPGSEGWAQQYGYHAGGGPGRQHSFIDPSQAAALTAGQPVPPGQPIPPHMIMSGQPSMMGSPNIGLTSGAGASPYGSPNASPMNSPVLQQRMLPMATSPAHGNMTAQLGNMNLSGLSGLASLPNPLPNPIMQGSASRPMSTRGPGGAPGTPSAPGSMPGTVAAPLPQALPGSTPSIPPQNLPMQGMMPSPMPPASYGSPQAQGPMPMPIPFPQGAPGVPPPGSDTGSAMKPDVGADASATDPAKQSCKIFVGGLPSSIAGEAFHEYFLKFVSWMPVLSPPLWLLPVVSHFCTFLASYGCQSYHAFHVYPPTAALGRSWTRLS